MRTIKLEISDQAYRELRSSLMASRLCHGSGAALETKVLAKVVEKIEAGEDTVIIKYKSEE